MPNTKRSPAGPSGAAASAAARASPKKDFVPVEPPEQLFDEVTAGRVTTLRTLATLARAVAKQHLSSESFHRVCRLAYDLKTVSADKLAELGRSDRTTASRWINAQSAPNAFAQEAILFKIAELAAEQADLLRGGMVDPGKDQQ